MRVRGPGLHELTVLELVTRLDNGRLPGRHRLRRGDRLPRRHFVSENLFHSTALLLGHLIIPGIEVFLLEGDYAINLSCAGCNLWLYIPLSAVSSEGKPNDHLEHEDLGQRPDTLLLASPLPTSPYYVHLSHPPRTLCWEPAHPHSHYSVQKSSWEENKESSARSRKLIVIG